MGYARILKDNSGRLSGYRECDGEVAFMPRQESYENIFRRVRIHLDSMEVLNHDFIKDRERVYRQGILLKGIVPADFRVFNAVYTGNHQVIYTPYGDAKVAHPSSFEALDTGIPGGRQFPFSYGRDEEFVYFFTGATDTRHAVRLKACRNPAAFSVLAGKYAKDDRHVYYEHSILKKADPKTFTVLRDGYARDCRHLFFHGNIVEDENGKTGIKETVLEEIRDLAQKHGVKKVILFGSRARGDFRRASDIDLAVSGGDISNFALDVDEETSTPLKYDVINLDEDIQEELRQAIESEGQVLYEEI